MKKAKGRNPENRSSVPVNLSARKTYRRRAIIRENAKGRKENCPPTPWKRSTRQPVHARKKNVTLVWMLMDIDTETLLIHSA